MRKICSFLFVFTISGCATGIKDLKPGQCVERPYGVYTYKVISVDDKVIKARSQGAYSEGVVSMRRNERLVRVACK